jgi:hypothetical protein
VAPPDRSWEVQIVNRPFVAQLSQFRVTWLAIGLLVGAILFARAVAIVAPRLGALGGNQNTATQQHPGYGTGYPQHGGLSGTPVRVENQGYGTGYPQHGGLSGPSQVNGQP